MKKPAICAAVGTSWNHTSDSTIGTSSPSFIKMEDRTMPCWRVHLCNRTNPPIWWYNVIIIRIIWYTAWTQSGRISTKISKPWKHKIYKIAKFVQKTIFFVWHWMYRSISVQCARHWIRNAWCHHLLRCTLCPRCQSFRHHGTPSPSQAQHSRHTW